MMADSDRIAELDKILADLCEETITPAQVAQLQELLGGDPEARKFYVNYIHLHASLDWDHSAEPDRDVLMHVRGLLSGSPKDDATVPPEASTTRAADSKPANNKPALFGFLEDAIPQTPWMRALILLVVISSVGVWFASRPTADLHQTNTVQAAATHYIATLIATPGCRWDSSSVPTEAGSRLVAGRLRLVEGDALITFDSGARVLLKGPAVFELESAKQARLLSGQLLAHVPERASGFAVLTAAGKVIDLGTEFGLVVDDRGVSEVHVFDGSVEVQDHSTAKQLLVAGEARRIDSFASTVWRGIELDDDRFLNSRLAPMLQGTVVEPLAFVDDFSDDLLNLNHWKVVTDGIPQGGAEVRQQGGQIMFLNRGHLVTREQFDPRVVGPIHIRGRWTFSVSGDYLQILTRSDGIPGGIYGETLNGIKFAVDRDTGYVGISEITGELSGELVMQRIDIDPKDSFDFEIMDDGLHLMFTVKKVESDDPAITVEAVSRMDFADDYIVFHNRERGSTSGLNRDLSPDGTNDIDKISYLDNVVIETHYDKASGNR